MPATMPTEPAHLALRAEGGPGRGVGHLARCLALAQAWVAKGGRASLVSTAVPQPWAARYSDVGVKVYAPGTGPTCDVWLVDGYDLRGTDGPSHRAQVRIDDHGLSPADPVDLLIDQNLGAEARTDPPGASQSLLGSRYCLIRRDLLDVAAHRSSAGTPKTASHIVVAGGGAPSPAVQASFSEVADGLRRTGHQVTVLDGASDPVTALAQADLAVCAAGSTVWECCLLGIPIVAVSVAANQIPLGTRLQRRGAAVYMGDLARLAPSEVVRRAEAVSGNEDLRASMVQRGRGIVDGLGAARVATAVRSLLVDLRPVTAGDIAVVHALNDDPVARATSFESGPIPWDTHERWFAARLVDPNSKMYLAADHQGRELGLIRFVVHHNVAELSVVVDPAHRDRGWGSAIICRGVRQLAVDGVGAAVEARVKRSNTASGQAFVSADFDPLPSDDPEVLRYAQRVPGATE